MQGAKVCILLFGAVLAVNSVVETNGSLPMQIDQRTINEMIRKKIILNTIQSIINKTIKVDPPVTYPPVTPTVEPLPHQDQIHLSVSEEADIENENCMLFPLNEHKGLNSTNTVHANLWIYVKRKKGKAKKWDKKTKQRKHRKGRRLDVTVTYSSKVLAKLRMRGSKSTWKKIELPVSYIANVIKTSNKIKLCLACKKCNKKNNIVLLYQRKRNKRKRKKPKPTTKPPLNLLRPFLVLETRPQHSWMRQKRSVRHPSCRRCCSKSSFYFSFQDSHFQNKIIAPEGFVYSYCDNVCQSNSSSDRNSGDYSNLQHSQTKTIQYCRPTGYEPVPILYFDSNSTVRYLALNDIKPTDCTCNG